MRKKQVFILLLLIITTNVARGNNNKTKTSKSTNKKQNVIKDDRIKRSLLEKEVSPLWTNRGKRQIHDDTQPLEYGFDHIPNRIIVKENDKLIQDPPFWGNRGRRDSSSDESKLDPEYHEHQSQYCEHCSNGISSSRHAYVKDRRDDFVSPFWGSRGRRDSNEIEDQSDPFWGNRGRRQEQEPFWGNRGRRTEDSPFSPFWGNRGRREEEPFWGNRGRREDVEPFWGNRGRRQDQEPFWGNRGRRQENEPFWGNRGRREEEPFWGNRGRRKLSDRDKNKKEDLKDSILKAIDDVQNDIEYLSRLKKRNLDPKSFWANRGRESKLNLFFNGPSRSRLMSKFGMKAKTSEPGSVLDNRMFVEEPNYILVERTNRASGEDDPYFISRGKKYNFEEQAARDRRGAIEEIVKSVRNDPYYIARGKKNTDINNSTATHDEYVKAKELICSAIDLIMMKGESGKHKREINDNDRDRRTILKKLAAQLQIDPYFVSRGKRSEIVRDQDYLPEFIKSVAEKCN